MSWGQVKIQRSTLKVQVAVAAICLFFALAADAAVTINNVTVTVLPQPTAFGSGETYHGYMEYRVALSNLSPDADKRVRLTLPASSWGRGGDQIRSVSRTVVLAPGASTVVSLLQPPVMIRGDGLGVWVNGESNRISLSMIDHAEPNAHSSNIGSALLVSQGTVASTRSSLQSRLDTSRSTATSVNQSEVPVTQWSSNWLSYSRFDGVMITADEMKDAPIGVVEALRRFTMAGGTLIVTGSTWQPPDDWRPQAAPARGLSEWYCGFGVVVVGPDDKTLERLVGTIADHVNTSTQPWRANRSIEEANNIFPVVDDLQIPKRGLLVLMIGFAVAIGPVNLWLLAKYKRRLWLLWTVPSFSLLTCLAVWVYATAAEGWSGHEKTAALTILDQENMTATTIGWAAFYAPITPGGGLRYDLATELTPQIGRLSGGYYYSRSGGRSRSINLGDTQHLVSGWVIARVPSHYQVRKPAETVRQRLNFRSASSGVEVVNGIGVDVKQLFYADDAGQVHTAGPIAAGETAPMNKSTDKVSAAPAEWRTLYASEWVGAGGSIGQAARSATKLLRPGTYVAVLDGEPFLESGLGKPKSRKSESVVIGYVGNSSAENGGTR
jgi:hypothetical protein